jgi:hypothetical protein
LEVAAFVGIPLHGRLRGAFDKFFLLPRARDRTRMRHLS